VGWEVWFANSVNITPWLPLLGLSNHVDKTKSYVAFVSKLKMCNELKVKAETSIQQQEDSHIDPPY